MNNDPVVHYAGYDQGPTLVIKPSNSRSSALKGLLAITGILVALMLGLLLLVLIGLETGVAALLIGMVAATLPVPVYVMLLLWIDRYESEPLWMLATTFFWGALIAVFIAFIVNTTSSILVAVATDSMSAAEAFGAIISAPVVEESAKALVLFILFFWRKDEFDGIVDGIVYAGMVGLGFAMTENIQYYGKALVEGGGAGLTGTFILRGAMAPFSHPLFTSMTGIGLGWARQSESQAIKFTMPVLGLLLAMFTHALWNASAVLFGGLGFLLVYFFIMVPIFIATLVTIIFALRREGRVLREHLLCDFQRGLFSQEEYNRLCSIRGRMGASFNALTSGGLGAWRARRQFNQLASELAFHRSRVARGLLSSEQAAEREAGYVQLLRELRRRLGAL
ncbi:MAG TPA: PrsW family intramembrane metalloprotease [Pyrinomonadaceae bacterium]|nr:PrsW family intramembrane metalloprotease [Pyrinomonadaceae bacterium]